MAWAFAPLMGTTITLVVFFPANGSQSQASMSSTPFAWMPTPNLAMLSPGRQAVSYLIAPTKTVIHASGSQAFTEPPLQDLLVNFPGSFGSPSFLGNPNLKPETDLGWEAGLEQPFLEGRLVPSATYFHNDIHGEIEDALQPTGNFVEENVSRATTDGVEIGVKINPISTVALNLGYTYLNASNDQTQMRLVRRPRNTLVFSGTWNPIPPLTLTLGGNWIVGREDIEDEPPYGQGNAPDYLFFAPAPIISSTITSRFGFAAKISRTKVISRLSATMPPALQLMAALKFRFN